MESATSGNRRYHWQVLFAQDSGEGLAVIDIFESQEDFRRICPKQLHGLRAQQKASKVQLSKQVDQANRERRKRETTTR